LEGTDIKSASSEKPALLNFLVEAGETSSLSAPKIILKSLIKRQALAVVFI